MPPERLGRGGPHAPAGRRDRSLRIDAGGLVADQPLEQRLEVGGRRCRWVRGAQPSGDRKSTRLNSSHMSISYAVFCLKKKTGFRSSEKSDPLYYTRLTVSKAQQHLATEKATPTHPIYGSHRSI